jgi:glycosyltransferase involved in cell wall biosynthesis
MASISFICPLFNKAAYLPAVIAALGRQALGHENQYIFIDDGSTDESLELVQSLTAGWPRCVYRRQENMGPAGATNAGIALSTGDYIKLLGSDDILAPYATDALLRGIEETGAVAIYSRGSYYKSASEIRFDEAGSGRHAVLFADPLAMVIRHTISGTSGTLFRAAAVKAVGGCDGRVFVEDFSLALRLAHHGPIADIDLLTSYGPAECPSRIMVGWKHQVFHDYNLALALFLADHPELPKYYGKLALRRAAGRAEKWVRRECQGEAAWLPYTLLRVASYFPFFDHTALTGATTAAFNLGPWARERKIRKTCADQAMKSFRPTLAS